MVQVEHASLDLPAGTQLSGTDALGYSNQRICGGHHKAVQPGPVVKPGGSHGSTQLSGHVSQSSSKGSLDNFPFWKFRVEILVGLCDGSNIRDSSHHRNHHIGSKL